MASYKPFQNLQTQTEDNHVHVDLDEDLILPQIAPLSKMLTPKKCIILGCIQILCAVCVLTTGFLWWFSCIVGSTGILIILAAINPYRGNQILVILTSLASMASSFALLYYARKWNGDESTKCAILITTGLIECVASISCVIMACNDTGCCCCVVSPNSSVVYFGRNKLQDQPYSTHGFQSTTPSELNASNYLTKLKNMGSIYRQKDLSNNSCKKDGDGQYIGAHHGPSHPPYLDCNSNNVIFNENNIIKGDSYISKF